MNLNLYVSLEVQSEVHDLYFICPKALRPIKQLII